MRFLDLHTPEPGEPGGERQPGISVFQNGKWLHGLEAFASCRQDPQSARFHVWEKLSLDDAGLPGGMRHSADLALAQLQHLCTDLPRDCWTVFTPVHWSKDQLRIFLGVAEACRMDVRVLLPGILAANHDLEKGPEIRIGWEWQWHQLYRVELLREDEDWRLHNFRAIPEGGILDFFRRQSRAAAKWALESRRLDPLHSGKTEQQLFENWWRWMKTGKPWTFRAGEVELILSAEAELGPAVHRKWAAQHEVPEGGEGSCPPGLARLLGWRNAVPEAEDLQAVEARLGDFSGQGARWKERLPARSRSAETALPVTHWVVDGIAEAVRENAGDARPGDRRKLEDGREALAVHVPAE